MALLVVPQSQSVMHVGRPAITGVISAASYGSAEVAPGELKASSGKSFGNSTHFTSVMVKCTKDPLVYATDGQTGAFIFYAAQQFRLQANIVKGVA